MTPTKKEPIRKSKMLSVSLSVSLSLSTAPKQRPEGPWAALELLWGPFCSTTPVLRKVVEQHCMVQPRHCCAGPVAGFAAGSWICYKRIHMWV